MAVATRWMTRRLNVGFRGKIAVLGLAALANWTVQAAEFDCLIEPRRVVSINGPVEAVISVVRVDRGDSVRRGDVLVEFDAGLEKATAALTRHRADILSTIEARRARSDYATLKHGRREQLTKENFVSRQEVDEAEAEMRLSAAELREAQDNQRTSQLEHARAMEALRLRTLLSPVSGVVIERLMHPGEVSELGKKPILRIAEIDTLHVEVILPAQAYRQVSRGDVVSVRTEAGQGGPFNARVTVVDSVIDASSNTFGVRLELANADRRIPAGSRCRADFPKVTAGTLPGAPAPKLPVRAAPAAAQAASR